MAGLEIDFLGATQADVDDLATLATQAVGKCILQARAGQAHIVAQHYRAGVELRCKCFADLAGHVFVEFAGHAAADVIGLEGGKGHASVLLGERCLV
ncbi:hypothetical protein D3C71_1124550 [compost metagenome]